MKFLKGLTVEAIKKAAIKANEFIIKTGKFTRLIDNENKLSLTNLGVILVMVKLGVSNDVVSPIDVTALIGVLLSYQAKRAIEAKKDK